MFYALGMIQKVPMPGYQTTPTSKPIIIYGYVMLSYYDKDLFLDGDYYRQYLDLCLYRTTGLK